MARVLREVRVRAGDVTMEAETKMTYFEDGGRGCAFFALKWVL